jgi:hypothetical protein
MCRTFLPLDGKASADNIQRALGVFDSRAQVPVADQGTSYDATDSGRYEQVQTLVILISRLNSYQMRRLHFHQVTNFRKGFRSGSLPRTRQSITTLRAKSITVGPPPGSLKVLSMTNGKRGVRSCGCTENVRHSVLFSSLLLIETGLAAGSGKSVLW